MVDIHPAVAARRDIEVIDGFCRGLAAGEVVMINVSGFSGVMILGAGGFGDAIKINFCSDATCTTQKLASDINISTEYNASYTQAKLAGAPVDANYPWLKIVNTDTTTNYVCLAVFGVR